MHKWCCPIELIIKEKRFNIIALIDSWADLNCIQLEIISTKYYKKTKELLNWVTLFFVLVWYLFGTN